MLAPCSYYPSFKTGNGIIALSLLMALLPLPSLAASFRVSQGGYQANAPKPVLLEDVPQSALSNPKSRLLIRDVNRLTLRKQPRTVLELRQGWQPVTDHSRLGPPVHSLKVDLDFLTTPGNYELVWEGDFTQRSVPFRVSNDVYWEALKAVAPRLVQQHCGDEVQQLAACHLKDAVWGGWHNSPSDPAKSVSDTTEALAHLLFLAQWEPNQVKYLSFNLPRQARKSTPELSDLHHESKTGLDWLMALQRKDTRQFHAGVSHPGRQLLAPTGEASAQAVAVLAMAARVYKKPELGYAVKCLLAAEDGWRALPADTPADLKAWAAGELFLATGRRDYHQAFAAQAIHTPWQAQASYLLYGTDANLKATLRRELEGEGQRVLGSDAPAFDPRANRDVLADISQLLVLDRVTGEPKHREGAARQMAHLFGVNPMGLSFVPGLEKTAVAEAPAAEGINLLATTVSTQRADAPDGHHRARQGLSLSDTAALVWVLGALNERFNTATTASQSD